MARRIKLITLVIGFLAPCFPTTIVRIPIKKKGAGPLFQIHHGKKWGFMNRSGTTVISPQFDDEGDFFSGLARVQNDGKWGYVDETGRVAIPYEFYNAGDFVEGLAPVQVGRKWGYINPAGKFIVEPQFQGAAEFSDGLARFVVWETIRCNREQYTKDTAPLGAFRMQDFTQAITSGCFAEDARFGFVDEHGKITIAPTFSVVTDFSEGLAAVQVGPLAESKYGYIDKTGNVAISPRFDQANAFHEGLAAVQTGFRAEGHKKVAGKWGFINKDGAYVIPPRFELTGNFSEGLADVAVELGDWGFIDRHGTFVIPPKFSETSYFSDGLAWVYGDDEESPYFIDKKGRKTLTLKLWALWPFSGGLTVVGNHEKDRVYVDRNGKVIAPYEIDPQ